MPEKIIYTNDPNIYECIPANLVIIIPKKGGEIKSILTAKRKTIKLTDSIFIAYDEWNGKGIITSNYADISISPDYDNITSTKEKPNRQILLTQNPRPLTFSECQDIYTILNRMVKYSKKQPEKQAITIWYKDDTDFKKYLYTLTYTHTDDNIIIFISFNIEPSTLGELQ